MATDPDLTSAASAPPPTGPGPWMRVRLSGTDDGGWVPLDLQRLAPFLRSLRQGAAVPPDATG